MIAVLIITIIMLLVWYMSYLNPQKKPISFETALYLSISLGIFLGYIVPWFIKLCPVNIRITNKSITMIRGNRNNIYKWVNITSFSFESIQDLNILQLLYKNGRIIEVAIGENIQKSELKDFFERIGLASTSKDK